MNNKPSGYNQSTHHLITIKEPGRGLVAFRTELPNHPEIYKYAQNGKSFEEVIAIVCSHLDIVVDTIFTEERLDKFLGGLALELKNKRTIILL